jgi:TolB-like protein
VVGQFSYNQSFNRLTKSLQEKLFTAMSNQGMQVVERDQLERVLKEQKLGYSGLVNMSSAKKIGKLLGAEGMMLGTVSDMGNSITINARLVDMENGKTITATEVELPKTPLIAQLLEIPVEDKPFTTQNDSAPKSRKIPEKTNQLFFENDMFHIDVVSFKRKGGSIELKLKYINRTQKVIQLELIKPRENAYIVDKLGNQYPYKLDEFGRGLDFPVGIPRISTITFRDMNGNSKEFIATVNYFASQGYKRFFAHFKGLNLE